MWIYFEAYNLTPGGRYQANVQLKPDGDGTPYDLEFTGIAPMAGRVVTPAGLRLDLAGARPGSYRLRLTVRDLATGRVTLPADTRIYLGDEEDAPAADSLDVVPAGAP
jgi:hypothetical protein